MTDILELSEEILRLRSALSEAEKERDNLENVVEDFSSNIDHARERTRQLAARAEKAEAELAQARKALEPFARFDTEDWPDSMRLFEDDPSLTMGHMRAARALIALIAHTGRTEGEQTDASA